MKIAIGSDHGGFNLKEEVKEYLTQLKIDVVDCGCYNLDSCDYPIYAKSVCESIISKKADKGILICTTGIGMAITANRYPNIRAALVSNEDMCMLTRKHNDSNILVIGAKYTSLELAKRYVDIFFATDFEGGRHDRRVKLIEKE